MNREAVTNIQMKAPAGQGASQTAYSQNCASSLKLNDKKSHHPSRSNQANNIQTKLRSRPTRQHRHSTLRGRHTRTRPRTQHTRRPIRKRRKRQTRRRRRVPRRVLCLHDPHDSHSHRVRGRGAGGGRARRSVLHDIRGVDTAVFDGGGLRDGEGLEDAGCGESSRGEASDAHVWKIFGLGCGWRNGDRLALATGMSFGPGSRVMCDARLECDEVVLLTFDAEMMNSRRCAAEMASKMVISRNALLFPGQA